jgi:hypothetical protein
MRDFSHLTWVYGRRGLYNHIQTSQLVGPEADILEYNVIGRSGFSPRIRGHEYYAPLKFDSIHSARQWARENSQRNRPIFWKANERMGEVGTTCNLMNDVDALRGLQEFIAAGARGTIADGRPLHFDIPGIIYVYIYTYTYAQQLTAGSASSTVTTRTRGPTKS